MATPPKKKRTGPSAFVRERARYLMAHAWCPSAANNDNVPSIYPKPGEDAYLSWLAAIEAGWVTGEKGRNPHGTIKAEGWKVATAFLKR